MDLNLQQQIFFDMVTNLDVNKIFLRGEAGTGKTHLLCEVAKFFDANGFDVVFASPTHQALQVIKNKMGTGHNVTFKTVASLLGRALLRGVEGEKFSLSPSLKTIRNYEVIIVDECSMIGKAEADTFLHSNLNDKIMIFTGDPNQLPPVMKKSGDLWFRVHNYFLTQQMRQHGEIYKLAKKNIDGVTIPTHSSEDIKVKHSEDALKESFLESITQDENPLDYLYLTYKNSDVDEMAARVHKALYGDTPYVEGQHLRLDVSLNIAAKGSEVTIVETVPVGEYLGFNAHMAIVEFDNNYEDVILIDPSEKANYERKLSKILNELKQLVRTNDSNDSNRDLIKITRNKLEELEDSFVPVISPYVMTVHKAQGITKRNVWVLSSSLHRAVNKRKLVYVAFSRATDRLVVNSLPVKIKGCTMHKILNDLKQAVGVKTYKKVQNNLKRTVRGFGLRGSQPKESKELLVKTLMSL